jgi:hypothetical protein
MDYVIGLEHVNYWSKIVDQDALTTATDEEPFDRASFEVLNELLQSVTVVAGLHRVTADGEPRAMERNEAILAGLIVRCMKLQHGVLSVCNPQRMELLIFYQRGITESAVNLAYLLEHGSAEIFDEFVRNSLRVDKGLYDEILQNIKERGGQELPIETRMLAGIKRSFKRGEIEIESVKADDRGAWSPKGMYGRFEAVGYGPLYRPFFQAQSHSIHGSWHDLFTYHLEEIADEGFVPDLAFSAVRPIPLLSAAEILAEAAVRYLRDVVPENEECEVLEDRIWICHAKAREIGSMHERFLQHQGD